MCASGKAYALYIPRWFGGELFDVSPYYGLTKAETVLGKALQGILREKYLLATKLDATAMISLISTFLRREPAASIDESLRRLGVDYLDLVQCHDIEFGSLDQIINETIPTLRKIQEQGKVRFVGITGLPLKIFPTVLDQVEVDNSFVLPLLSE